MKKRFTKYFLTIAILPAFLTGCYTQLAIQDDSSTIPADLTSDDYAYYEEEEVSPGGYFDVCCSCGSFSIFFPHQKVTSDDRNSKRVRERKI